MEELSDMFRRLDEEFSKTKIAVVSSQSRMSDDVREASNVALSQPAVNPKTPTLADGLKLLIWDTSEIFYPDKDASCPNANGLAPVYTTSPEQQAGRSISQAGQLPRTGTKGSASTQCIPALNTVIPPRTKFSSLISKTTFNSPKKYTVIALGIDSKGGLQKDYSSEDDFLL